MVYRENEVISGPGLPQRPRSHVLDTASERAFKVELPSEWLATPPERDYGLDLQAEIFTDTGGQVFVPTGLQFGVQLKATDDEEKEALRVGIRREHLNYWTSLSVPVLLVRYLATEDRLYATWVHRHFRSFILSRTARAWFVFDRDEDALTRERADQLEQEVRGFAAIRQRQIDWPLQVTLVDQMGESVLVSRLLYEAGQLQTGLARKVDFRVGERSVGGAVLVLGSGRMEFDLGGGFAGVVETEGRTRELLAAPSGPADVLGLVASVLANVGFEDAATQLVQRVLASLTLLRGSMPVSLGIAAARCGQRQTVLQLIERAAPWSPEAVVLLANLLVPPSPHRLEPDERGRIESALRQACESARPERTASLRYGLGNWLRRTFALDAAEIAYHETASIDQAFEARSHFWFELAGIYFETHQLDKARVAYARAIELGDDSAIARAFYADVLLHQGLYAEAAAEFADASNGGDDTPFAVVGALASSLIAQRAGPRQDRDMEAARSLIDRAQASQGASIPDLIEDVQAHDALHPFPWALAALRAPRPVATPLHVASAFLNRFNLESWRHAVMSVLAQQPNTRLCTSVVRLAVHYEGDLLEPAANELANEHLSAIASVVSPDERAEAQRAIASQLMELRTLVGEARRAQGSGDLLRPN